MLMFGTYQERHHPLRDRTPIDEILGARRALLVSGPLMHSLDNRPVYRRVLHQYELALWYAAVMTSAVQDERYTQHRPM